MAERAIRTAISMARTILIESGLNVRFWSKAINHVERILNLLPNAHTRNSRWDSPTHWITSTKPDLSREKVFGCQTYVKIPDRHHINKFDPKAIPCFYIGRSDDTQSYLSWSPTEAVYRSSPHTEFYEHYTMGGATKRKDDFEGLQDVIPNEKRQRALNKFCKTFSN